MSSAARSLSRLRRVRADPEQRIEPVDRGTRSRPAGARSSRRGRCAPSRARRRPTPARRASRATSAGSRMCARRRPQASGMRTRSLHIRCGAASRERFGNAAGDRACAGRAVRLPDAVNRRSRNACIASARSSNDAAGDPEPRQRRCTIVHVARFDACRADDDVAGVVACRIAISNAAGQRLGGALCPRRAPMTAAASVSSGSSCRDREDRGPQRMPFRSRPPAQQRNDQMRGKQDDRRLDHRRLLSRLARSTRSAMRSSSSRETPDRPCRAALRRPAPASPGRRCRARASAPTGWRRDGTAPADTRSAAALPRGGCGPSPRARAAARGRWSRRARPVSSDITSATVARPRRCRMSMICRSRRLRWRRRHA